MFRHLINVFFYAKHENCLKLGSFLIVNLLLPSSLKSTSLLSWSVGISILPWIFYCDTLKNIALDFSIENDSKQKKVNYQLPDYLCLIPISDPISNLHNYMARAVFTSSFGPATLTELNQLSWYVHQIWIIHATIFEKFLAKGWKQFKLVFFFYFNSKIKEKNLFPTQTLN